MRYVRRLHAAEEFGAAAVATAISPAVRVGEQVGLGGRAGRCGCHDPQSAACAIGEGKKKQDVRRYQIIRNYYGVTVIETLSNRRPAPPRHTIIRNYYGDTVIETLSNRRPAPPRHTIIRNYYGDTVWYGIAILGSNSLGGQKKVGKYGSRRRRRQPPGEGGYVGGMVASGRAGTTRRCENVTA